MMHNILLIEDDLYIREIYIHVFKNAGYEVDQAEDGEEAIGLLEKRDYDFILLDIMLPKISGIDVLKHIRGEGSRSQNTPVVLITNLGQESILEEAMKMGSNGYILKSQANVNDVVRVVDDYLQKK